MGIQKFESFEDAERALWCFEPDEQYYKRVRELFALASRLNPPRFPQGVFRYESLEAANKQKQEWILQNALNKKITE